MSQSSGKDTPSRERSISLISSGRLRHIAFIMDGNGRWAAKRGLPRKVGHRYGASAFREIARYCANIGIEYMTFYAFSTENWGRPGDEVESIIKLLGDYMDECEKTAARDSLRMRFIGDLSAFGEAFVERARKLEAATAHYSHGLNIALGYGGRDEIVRACRKLAERGEEITEEAIGANLDTAGIPDPDLIVRTAGEKRLSNFLMWQSAYSEFYFTDTLWPDMKPHDIDLAVEEFFGRKRRYGKV